jgi:hypothetical protein
MLEASCHCGAVRIRVPERPSELTSCNCSLCHRLGTLWAYYPADEIVLLGGPTVPYVHGPRTLAVHHCPGCGCITHWQGLGGGREGWAAVNGRLMDPDEIGDVPVHRFDGASSWTYLD